MTMTVLSLAVRLAARSNTLTIPTAGLAPSHVQANLIILPARYVRDFRLLCQRNPVPCPLLAEPVSPGSINQLRWYIPAPSSSASTDIDLWRDAPRYRIYTDGACGETEPADSWAMLWGT